MSAVGSAPPLDGCVCVNGGFFRPAEAMISALDPGLQSGDGVFETMRTYGGLPFRLAAHLDRLHSALEVVAIPPPVPRPELERLVAETVQRASLAEAKVRVVVTRGSTLVISALPLTQIPSERYQRGLRACSLWRRSSDDRPPPTIKSTSYQRTALARLELSRRGLDEGFYLDEQGAVTEGTTCNVFALWGGKLHTPPLDCCLPGVTRAEVISLAGEVGLEVFERTLPLSLLASATELFVTSSVSELTPVVELDAAPIGGGAPGAWTQRLHQLYRARAQATT